MFLRVATVAALLLAPLYAQAPAKTKTETAAGLPDAREIINRHVKAIGGREIILARQSFHGIGTLSVPAQGMSGPIEIFAAANPNRTLMKTTMPGIGEMFEGFDGSHGYTLSPLTGPMLKVGRELTQVKFDADFYGDLRDPRSYLEVKTLEKTTFDGRPCYKVSLKRIDGVEDFDFYDAVTGLRAGSINTRETQMGVITMTSTETDYRKLGKLLQAMSVSQEIMGTVQKITLSTVEYDKVQASAFEPPPPVKALIR